MIRVHANLGSTYSNLYKRIKSENDIYLDQGSCENEFCKNKMYS